MASGKGFILGMFAETSLHPGSGQAADVIDLPVSREATTGLPQIPETGLKGALRQWARSTKNDDKCIFQEETRKRLFGTAEADGMSESQSAGEVTGFGAGELLISTARLLCMPVRQLNGPYAWVTCPMLLERLQRDAARCEMPLEFDIPEPADFVAGENPSDPTLLVKDGHGQTVFLEEFTFKVQPLKNQALIDAILKFVRGDDNMKKRLAGRFAVMSDTEFSWYAENALPVDARNVLNENSKMSENLWYEETLPPDTLMYSVILPRILETEKQDEKEERFNTFRDTLSEQGYLQVGGNETVGQGWVSLTTRAPTP